MDISVVIPVYGCPGAIHSLCERLVSTLTKITNEYEIILVNDGCPMGSWENIVNECNENSHIVGINLSRNFGQINATNAGIDYSQGDYVVVMDCDLQDRPEVILKLFEKIKEGYDVVYVARKKRKESFLVKYLSKKFYQVYNSMVEGYYNPEIGNYCIATRWIVDKYCRMQEHNKSYTTMLCWMGYRSAMIEEESDCRHEGKSSYNLHKKINLAIDMITFQSNKPLRFCAKIGVIIGLMAFLFILFQLMVYCTVGGSPSGWMSLIAVVCLLGGIQLFFIGVIGIYIGNIFNETKNRESYYIQEIVNGENDS